MRVWLNFGRHPNAQSLGLMHPQNRRLKSSKAGSRVSKRKVFEVQANHANVYLSTLGILSGWWGGVGVSPLAHFSSAKVLEVGASFTGLWYH